MSRFGDIQVRSDPEFVASGSYYGGGFEPYNQGNDPLDEPEFGPAVAGLAGIRLFFTGIRTGQCTGCLGSPPRTARKGEGQFHGWIIPQSYDPVAQRYSSGFASGMPVSTKYLHADANDCAAAPCNGPIQSISNGSGTFSWDVSPGNGSLKVEVFDVSSVAIFLANGFLPPNGETVVLPNLSTTLPFGDIGTGGFVIIKRVPL